MKHYGTIVELKETLDESDDVEEVWNLIHDRLETGKVRDYDVADMILDHLYEEYRRSVHLHLLLEYQIRPFDVPFHCGVYNYHHHIDSHK